MKFAPVDITKLTKPTRNVWCVFLHCSASDSPEHDSAKVMEEWHLKRGFKEIGYHFFVRKDGTIEAGRSLEITPAAQQGHNTGSIAICAHGLLKQAFTAEQLASVKALCLTLNQLYGGGLTFHGHREVANKTCPVFDYQKLLGLNAAGVML